MYVFLCRMVIVCSTRVSQCGASISKFYNTPSGNVSALVTAIYEKGPISIAIDASHKSLSFYANGVYYEKDCGTYMYVQRISGTVFSAENFFLETYYSAHLEGVSIPYFSPFLGPFRVFVLT